MDYQPLIWLGSLGAVGYVVFHGHRIGKDCSWCQYRGMAFLGSALLMGAFLAYNSD